MKIIHGDCIEELKKLPENSVDSVVTDPPYGIGFMGKAWDTFKPDEVQKKAEVERKRKMIPLEGLAHPQNHTVSSFGAASYAGMYDLSPKGVRNYQSWCEEWARECLRVLKPGGHLLASNSPRMYHRMVSGIEDGGFEIRDTIAWVYGSGFPKSHNLHGDWEGWGSALKPAFEPIVIARKPFKGTLKENVLTHGTGGLNIDGSRVGTESITQYKVDAKAWHGNNFGAKEQQQTGETTQTTGRWPANLIHDGSEEVLECFPNESQRFFYCAKASKKDRNEGLEGFENSILARSGGAQVAEAKGEDYTEGQGIGLNRVMQVKNNHPTVKPTALMRYLVKLVTPPGGTVLDPFTGSGSTGKACKLEGFEFIGIEREEEYVKIAEARIAAVIHQPTLV